MCLRNLKLESFRELSLERLKALLYSEKDFPVQLTKPVRGLKKESFFFCFWIRSSKSVFPERIFSDHDSVNLILDQNPLLKR